MQGGTTNGGRLPLRLGEDDVEEVRGAPVGSKPAVRESHPWGERGGGLAGRAQWP